ncbi:MAG: hypothetical protein V3W04_11915 [Gammaproteobacteria bacterium]
MVKLVERSILEKPGSHVQSSATPGTLGAEAHETGRLSKKSG